ncbi:MAG TPA: hypothetical protein VN081_05005 [Dongiaceae bacterium]|nr:hypothetical protein [Dongiaceae bacterium]
MAYLLVFLAFVLKHFLATNALDDWYTNARDRHMRNWSLFVILQSLFEGVLSLPAYYVIRYDHPWQLVTMEMMMLALSALLERIPDYSRMIIYHIVAEVGILILYGYLTYKVLGS